MRLRGRTRHEDNDRVLTSLRPPSGDAVAEPRLVRFGVFAILKSKVDVWGTGRMCPRARATGGFCMAVAY